MQQKRDELRVKQQTLEDTEFNLQEELQNFQQIHTDLLERKSELTRQIVKEDPKVIKFDLNLKREEKKLLDEQNRVRQNKVAEAK